MCRRVHNADCVGECICGLVAAKANVCPGTDAQCTTQAHLNIHADLIEDTLDTIIINQLTQCKVGFVLLRVEGWSGQGGRQEVEDVDNATLELIVIAYKRSHSLLLSWSLISWANQKSMNYIVYLLNTLVSYVFLCYLAIVYLVSW